MKSPFKFLDSYTKDDRDIFFGREREIEELYHRVFESKIMLVYGVSGTGKSSLIQCGLSNKFQETDWLPLVIRRGGNILDNLALAIKAASITPQNGEIQTPLHFKKAVRSLYLDHYKPVFFIFDQFEELFIFGNKDEKRTFIQTIKAIVESDIQCRFIFVMREEYMASFTEFERYVPTIFQNRVRIEKMSHINAIEAIKGPCKFAGIDVEEGFAETLLEKLSPGSADVELTYLQVFLDRILKASNPTEGKVSFTTSLLSQVGDVSDLLGSFLDEQISLLSDPDTGLAVLKSFVSVKGTKQPMKVDEVKDYVMTLGRNPDETSLAEMIQLFVSLRILCDKDQHDRYELRHDALAAKIFEKFTLVEKELLEVRKFVENAYFTYESRSILLSKADLEYLAGYQSKLILPQTLNDFVNQSRQKLSSQKRALKRITSWSALVFILLLLAVGRFYLRGQKDVRDRDQLGLALIESERSPIKGFFTFMSLWDIDSSSTQLHHLIINSFQNLIFTNYDSAASMSRLQQFLKPTKTESLIENARLSKNGKYIFGWMVNHRVFVYNTSSNNINYFKSDGKICHLELSENDSLIALVYRNNKGQICDLNGNKKYSFDVTLNDVNNENLVRFFQSGSYLLAFATGSEVNILDRSGNIAFKLSGHKGRINSLDISPDERFIVTVSDDKRGYIWNFNSTTKSYGIYDSLVSHKNTVWSCHFNNSGNYIITASADSNIKIWNLSGKQINPMFTFFKRTGENSRYRLNNGEKDEDASNPKYSNYYGKFCDAEFTNHESEIIAKGYRIKKDSASKEVPEYYKVIFLGGAGEFPSASGTTFYSSSSGNDTIMSPNFREVIISDDEKLAAFSDEKNNEITLLTGDGRIMSSFKGSQPLFSKDSYELFWVRDQSICRFPVSPAKMKSLLEHYNISNDSKDRLNITIGF